MNVDLRPSTCRMIETSSAASDAWAFIRSLRAEAYIDYVIDCHFRRLLYVMPRLSPARCASLSAFTRGVIRTRFRGRWTARDI